MGSKTIKICDYCEKELAPESHSIRLNGVSNFGDWKNLEFCNIMCFMSYMDGNIRAYKEALEKELSKAIDQSDHLNDGNEADRFIRMLTAGSTRPRLFLEEEFALYDLYTKKFEYNPFEEEEKRPSGVRHLELD